MTSLLERDRELGELAEMVAAARNGAGRLAVIEAPAGLGKTRLVQAARAAGSDAGMHVLSARATELERDFPYALVRQLLEPALARLAADERDTLFDGAGGPARRALGLDGGGHASAERPVDAFAVLHGLYWLVAGLAERTPLLLAVDDAHWSDPASLDTLAFLLPRLEELPLLLVVACRPDEAAADAGLARIATDTLARRLTPRALSPAATAALLTAELDRAPEHPFAAVCHEASGGNPFLLGELARTIAAREIAPLATEADRVRELAPERVTRTVLVRLARCSPHARATAHALVVLGDDADPRLVAELAGLGANATSAAADELRAAAILDPEPALRFLHPLVRTALAADLPAGERASAHARAAALLRERGARPEQLAAHLVATEARGERETVEALLAAGRGALASGASRSASAYLARAWREPAPPDLRSAVLHQLVTACIRALDLAPLEALGIDLPLELDRDPRLLLHTAAELGPWVAYDQRGEGATTLLERAIALAVEAGDLERAIHVEGQLIGLARLPPEAGRERLAPYRVAPDEPSARLLAAFDAAWTLFDGDAATGARLARTALADGAIFAEHPQLLVLGEALHALVLADDLDAAQAATDRAVEIARGRDALFDLMAAHFLRTHVTLARGDLSAAQADLQQTCSLMRLRGAAPPSVPSIAALEIAILLARGELAAAEASLVATGMARGSVTDVLFLDPFQFARGRLHHALGRPRQAVDDLAPLHERRTRSGAIRSPFMQVGAALARPLAALGEHERARALAEADLVQARRWGAPAPLARALRAVAATVPAPAAIEPLEEARRALDGSPARLDRARALVELGAALRRANRRADAREPLRDGLELARRCGATGLAKHAHDELAATGERVRRYTPIGVESLSPSERRVAELAAGGMTNRQIAQTLFLTVKTIESHLGAAYDKLGIRSRRDLPTKLAGAEDARRATASR